MIKKVLQDLEINLLNSGIGLRSEKLKRTPDAKLKKRTVSTAKKTPSKRDSTHAERRESVFNLIRPWGMLLPDEFMHMVASLSEDQKSEILDTLIHIEDKDFSHLSGALEDSLLSNASTVMMPSENLPTQGQCIGEEERKRDSIIMSEFQILGARFLKVLRESGSPIISAPRPNSNSEELQPEINSMPSAETPCGANNEESGIEMPVVFKPSKTLLRTPPQSALKPPLELATSPSTDEDKTAVIETTPSLQPQGGPLGLLSATKSDLKPTQEPIHREEINAPFTVCDPPVLPMLRSPAPIVLSASEDMKYLQRRLHNLEAQLAENQRELLLIKEAEEAYASRLRFELENRLEEESKQRHELERKLASLEDAVMDSQIQAKKESLLRIDCQLKLLELQRQREQENKERKERERPFLSPINSTINSPEVVLYSSIRRTFSLSLNENETPPFPNTTARTAEKVPHFNENSSPEIEQTPAPSSLDTDLIETGPILDEGLHHVEKVLDLNDHSSPENEPISVPFSAADQSIEGERMTLCSTSARPEASFFSPTCADESLPHEISSFYDTGDEEGGVIVDPPLKYRGTVLRLIPLVAPILRPAPYGDATPKAMKKEKVHTEEEEAEFKRKKKMKRSKQVPVMKTRKRKASLSSKKQKEAQQKQIKEIVETSTEVEQVTEVALPERDEVSAAASNMDVITGTFDALKRQEDACNVDVPEDMKQNKKRPRKQAKRREGVSVIEDAIESDDKEEPTEAKKKRLRRKKTAKCSNEVNDSSNCALPTSGEVLNGDPVPAKSFDEVAPHKKVDIFDNDLLKDTHQNKKRPRKEVKKQVIVEPKAAEKKDNIIAELSSVQSSFSRVLKLPSLESSTISSGKFIVPKLKSQVTNKAV